MSRMKTVSGTKPFLYTQAWAADWARRNFGHEFWTTRERALRFFEEATELAVACGVGTWEEVQPVRKFKRAAA